MIQWKPDCWQWKQKQKNKLIEMLVTMGCDWFISPSASAVSPMNCTKIWNKCETYYDNRELKNHDEVHDHDVSWLGKDRNKNVSLGGKKES